MMTLANRSTCFYLYNFFIDTDRKEYIREHFAKIYRKDPNEPEDLRGCIENFLGEEILNNPVVADSLKFA